MDPNQSNMSINSIGTDTEMVAIYKPKVPKTFIIPSPLNSERPILAMKEKFGTNDSSHEEESGVFNKKKSVERVV